MLYRLRLLIRSILGKNKYESFLFFLKNHYWPDLEGPKTFNEKISTLKINSKDSRFVELSDKLKVRDYVSRKVGDEYLTDLFGTYQTQEEFRLDELPNRFVLKANHASGSNFIKIIKSKNDINETEIKKWMKCSLAQDYGIKTNEWWYNLVEPRAIIAEELLNPGSEDLKDYKFLVNNGEILFVQVDLERFTNHKRNIYDKDWNQIDVAYKYPKGKKEAPPSRFDEMKKIAIELGKEFRTVRVDLYLTENERIIFGELTFAPEAGWGKFMPRTFDYEFGKKLST